MTDPRPRLESEITALIDAARRSRLAPHLGDKPVSLTEARAAIRRTEVYEQTHGPIPEPERLDLLVSLVLSRRSQGVARILDDFTSLQVQEEYKSRRTTWDAQLRAIEAPRHRLVPRVLRAWEERPL